MVPLRRAVLRLLLTLVVGGCVIVAAQPDSDATHPAAGLVR